MIRTILVDDHALFRLGVKSAIMNGHTDIGIVGEADSGTVLFCLLETTTPDIILLDILLPDMTGTTIARRLRKEYPAIKILAISAENTAEVVQEMIEIGIEGFISKRQGGVDEIAEAIRTIMNGYEYFGHDISAIIYKIYVSKKRTADVTPEFTDREREVIGLCRDGLLSKQIAERLCISSRTVDNHKNNIFRKLGINNTMEMVQYALKHGIIRIE
ncbi:DNA-binding NarL/FixJ family response regulator [Parabacteroides sp. PFB2-10]|uniref:response regulator transcription factor n=1 Tax=Parabacteroides sp. PFB2-10 TaxID=1742405 RepID=UPI00247553E8|nr:response regulator transcription factor [Parabacteroides sp. PFB2-10]MDH6312753.1 DNA-binding NarL/FixJ family response regulator [Parabacteroides sp. PFB2-10]